MSSLQYSYYKGIGEFASKHFGYSQAVRIGDRIECSGQGGWHPHEAAMPTFPSSIDEQIAQAFENVDITLKAAGGQGFGQVFRVNSYHTEINPQVSAAMKKGFEKWMPDHQPIWTQIGVKQLGVPGMEVEIEVVAYDPK